MKMKSILDYVKSLLPSIPKATLANEFTSLEFELKNNLLPVYQNFIDSGIDIALNKPKAYRSKWAMGLDYDIMNNKEVNLRCRDFRYRPENMVHLTFQVLTTMQDKLKVLQAILNQDKSDALQDINLDQRQANVIRLVEMTSFYFIYSRRLLIRLMDEEDINLTDPAFTKADVIWMDRNAMTFRMMTAIFSYDNSKFSTVLSSIPQLVVIGKDELDEAVTSNIGPQDPFALGFVPYVGTAIFHVRKKIVEWRNARIESARAELETIELRLQQLMNRRDGTPNARLEKVIENTQERMKKLNKRLADMEASYRHDYGIED